MSSSRRLAGHLRRVVLAHLGRSESGITFVVFALAIVVILGMVAVGIDGGRLYDERRKAQNAADHAATTAAHAMCARVLTSGQAISAGEASALANGYDNNGTTNTVTVAYEGGTRFTATIETTIPSTFAVIIGWENLTTGGKATSECTGSAGDAPGAIWAGGDDCFSASDKTVEVTGSNQDVYGGVHSNKDVKISGSTNRFTDEPTPPDDPFTYVGNFQEGGSGNTYETGSPSQVPLPSPQWPGGYSPNDASTSLFNKYRDAAIANGTYYTSKVTALNKNGVYYTTSTQGMDISQIPGGTRTVVLVAPNGPIKVSGSNWHLEPYNAPGLPRPNLLMLSGLIQPDNNKCSEFVIATSGSNSTWNGIVWGPGGLIEFSGSDNSATNGALIGWAVRLNGSDLDIVFDSDAYVYNPDILMLE
jgi:Flp pilus assembly protein TadG